MHDRKKKEGKKKRTEDKGYLMKKDTQMKLLRIIFWFLLIFVFIRGLTTVLRPDQSKEVNKMIKQFRDDMEKYKKNSNEAADFAQNFVKEYLTYQKGGEEEYRDRIKNYVTSDIALYSDIWDFSGTARAVYAQAYRQEEYSENQIDVYVLADVEYEKQIMTEEQDSFETVKSIRTTKLKVPVCIKDGCYIVENIPSFINDDLQIKEHQKTEFTGTEVDENEKAIIQSSLVNFLNAYYTQEQSVIDYYLGKEADKNDFIGLQGRYSFIAVDDLTCFQEEGDKEIICQMSYKIRDTENNAVLSQALTFAIYKVSDKYYINKMESRTADLHF